MELVARSGVVEEEREVRKQVEVVADAVTPSPSCWHCGGFAAIRTNRCSGTSRRRRSVSIVPKRPIDPSLTARAGIWSVEFQVPRYPIPGQREAVQRVAAGCSGRAPLTLR